MDGNWAGELLLDHKLVRLGEYAHGAPWQSRFDGVQLFPEPVNLGGHSGEGVLVRFVNALEGRRLLPEHRDDLVAVDCVLERIHNCLPIRTLLDGVDNSLAARFQKGVTVRSGMQAAEKADQICTGSPAASTGLATLPLHRLMTRGGCERLNRRSSR